MAKADKPPPADATQTIGLPTRPQRPTDPVPHLSDYRFIKVIGRGAFGTVWLAEEPVAGVFRAIKVLHTHGAARIERELAGIHAYQAQAKDHPYLVRILTTGLCTLDLAADAPVGRDGATSPAPHSTQAVYYVMEIADHAAGAQPHHPTTYEPMTLATLIRQKDRLPTGGVIDHASTLLDAIDHLHRAGLQHRDIKPTNCLFIGGLLKLADMGLAASDTTTESIGTPAYMPPTTDKPTEADPARTIGPQPDDLYALGKVMYVMTTGQGAADFPDWPADLDPTADPHLPALRELINDLCHPQAEKRLTSIRELRHRLATFTPFGPSPKTSRRRVALLVGLVAAVSFYAGAWTATRWLEPEDPMSRTYGVPPYNGTDYSEHLEWERLTYSLGRSHRPGITYTLPCGGTFVTFWDIQTRLEEGRLEVSGAFQIYQEHSPAQRDITNPRGIICQVCLCVGDELRFLYHAQPGPKPGTYHDFGRRGMTGISLSELAFTEDEPLTVYLAVSSCYTPSSAAEEYKIPAKRVALLKNAQVIASVSRLRAEEAAQSVAEPSHAAIPDKNESKPPGND